MRRRPLHKRILLRLARTFRPVVNLTYHGHVLAVDTRDLYIGGELFLDGTWQDYLTTLIVRLGIDGMVAVDAGANIGVFTVMMSDAVGARGRVLAIEPVPWMHGILRRNVSRLPGNVSLFGTAVGEAPGEATIHTDPRELGNSRIESHEGCGRCTRVTVTTIDALTAGLPDGVVGLMKVDVQGFERAVLSGARDTLGRNEDLILMLEVECDETRQLVAELWDEGWRGWELTRTTTSRLEGPVRRWMLCDLVLSRSETGRARIDAAISAAR